MNETLKRLALIAASMGRGNEPAPEPDPFEPESRPYAVLAGDNKLGLFECATCGKPPTQLKHSNIAVFMFDSIISCKEHRISGMCQACQDSTFTRTVWS